MPYLDFELKYVGWLMPCLRKISAIGTPASHSFRIATILDSVDRDFRRMPYRQAPKSVYSTVPTR